MSQTFQNILRAEFVEHVPSDKGHTVSDPDSVGNPLIVHDEGVSSHVDKEGSNVRMTVVGRQSHGSQTQIILTVNVTLLKKSQMVILVSQMTINTHPTFL